MGRPPRPYLTLAEAARHSGISLRTITRWANAGPLPCVIVDGEPRVAREDLEAFVSRLDEPGA